MAILIYYSIGNGTTFWDNCTLKLPKFLFTDTTIFVNFLLEKSGIEFSYLFVNLLV